MQKGSEIEQVVCSKCGRKLAFEKVDMYGGLTSIEAEPHACPTLMHNAFNQVKGGNKT